MLRSESKKYTPARGLMTIGTDRDSFGKPFQPSRVEFLDLVFQKVPQRIWRRLVREKRAKATKQTAQHGMFFNLFYS